MNNKTIITSEYFREYRYELGFSNQLEVKDFFGTKDIIPSVDLTYVEHLNKRLYEIIEKINSVVVNEIKINNLQSFNKKYIEKTYQIIRSNDILPRLNNQGRRPEHVYFSWMRGYILTNYFLKALGIIFEVDLENINLIGDDNLKKIDTFKKTPKADIEIKLKKSEILRIEMQSGFTGVNDIKQHKVLEAKSVAKDLNIHTLAIHFDLYNGQVAFVKLDDIDDNSINWITRQQMEGQTVFNIEQNHFVWKITESPILYRNINFH